MSKRAPFKSRAWINQNLQLRTSHCLPKVNTDLPWLWGFTPFLFDRELCICPTIVSYMCAWGEGGTVTCVILFLSCGSGNET
jgi:hypothetical protein